MGRVVVDLSPVNMYLGLSKDAVWSFNRTWCVCLFCRSMDRPLHTLRQCRIGLPTAITDPFFPASLRFIKRLLSLSLFFSRLLLF
jgi:hypothetical protein